MITQTRPPKPPDEPDVLRKCPTCGKFKPKTEENFEIYWYTRNFNWYWRGDCRLCFQEKKNERARERRSLPSFSRTSNISRTAKQIAAGDQCGPDYSWQRGRNYILAQLEAMEDSEATPRQWISLLTELEKHIEIIESKIEREGNGTSPHRNYHEEEVVRTGGRGSTDPLRGGYVNLGTAS